MFALGNKTYEHYNAMGKYVDQRLAELGAQRIFDLGMGDDDGKWVTLIIVCLTTFCWSCAYIFEVFLCFTSLHFKAKSLPSFPTAFYAKHDISCIEKPNIQLEEIELKISSQYLFSHKIWYWHVHASQHFFAFDG